jgi:predicted dehydrogenase
MAEMPEMAEKEQLAVAVIGVGAMGRRHAQALAAGAIRGARLAAVADPNDPALEGFEVPRFDHAEALLDAGLASALVIAAPHPEHARLTIAALEGGLHVLVEKPAFVERAEGERVLARYAALPAPRPLAGVALTLRADPRYALIRDLVRGGRLGRVHRFAWTLTDRFRPASYYGESSWRGSFRGEGGGLLLNQCAHQLDQLGWWFGAALRAQGFCRFGRFHDVEVEDDVTAYLEFENDVTGTFVASTGELPGTHRLEIAGELGKLCLDDAGLSLSLPVPSRKEAWLGSRERPRVERELLSAAAPNPMSVLQNFVDAVRGDAALLAPLEQGLSSVELANALVLSSLTRSLVELPLDGARYSALLAELRAGGVSAAPR